MVLGILLAAIGGMVAGSLANFVAYRLVHDEPLHKLRPRCEQCEVALAPRDLVPVVAWVRLKGRCRACGEPIARRHLLVEAGTGVLFVAVTIARYDEAAEVALGLALVTFLVALALIDLDTLLLPDKVTLPAAVTAIALGLLLDRSGETGRLLAGGLAGAFFLLAALAYPSGLGMGDVKLAVVLGLFLGRDVAAALPAALVAGVLVGLVIIGRKGLQEGRRTAVPFGPFLAFGGIFALLWGEGIVDAYVAGF